MSERDRPVQYLGTTALIGFTAEEIATAADIEGRLRDSIGYIRANVDLADIREAA